VRFRRRRDAATSGSGDGPRRKRLFVLPLALIALLAFAIIASAGPVGTDSGFEDDDGNLVVDSTFDWNGLDPDTSSTASPNGWVGTAPQRTATSTASGWEFHGFEDWQATTADSGFAGGTKQDAECPTVGTQKADNKADLKRYYVANKEVNGDDYLELAWIRIPQNTTSPSAHVAFEFNKSLDLCRPNGTDGVVERSAGDMLVVYDFEGGSTDTPTLRLERWVTSGSCEIGSHSPPCWGPAKVLTDPAGCPNQDDPQNPVACAEGKVNTATTTRDKVAPNPGTLGELLGVSEFGEAGINLTEAGVTTPIGCGGFATTFAVSRTSGNSGTAQMKDVVGPGNLGTDCGAVAITKTSTKGDVGLEGATFELKDPDGNVINDPDGNAVWTTDSDGTFCASGLVIADGYTVQEKSAPTGYQIDNEDPVTVDITGAGDCDSGAATASFSDTPLSDIQVLFTSQAQDGDGKDITAADISCQDTSDLQNPVDVAPDPADSTEGAFDDTDETIKDLVPGTYTCTVRVDP
jgi:hypothetical protein